MQEFDDVLWAISEVYSSYKELHPKNFTRTVNAFCVIANMSYECMYFEQLSANFVLKDESGDKVDCKVTFTDKGRYKVNEYSCSFQD